ncbi:uncharacterized protein MONBRDRAFT_34744 [Monosiga brevicollis MX1]|uniref:YrhK domain-containing protein n=1 Tax=Monosiga brevicollis TaxID=81824 RepID=A9VDR0_MONBE|nr:uncharacterized protein MONBRDRAFT_34744 [Monosiga brevicollis MX1]EDQ84364.1 predicted protein [Monosiga brevicollis MX1]|eukprot:XP_001750860.1 hypothetical protein [Monosiga brevicollis MX1]
MQPTPPSTDSTPRSAEHIVSVLGHDLDQTMIEETNTFERGSPASAPAEWLNIDAPVPLAHTTTAINASVPALGDAANEDYDNLSAHPSQLTSLRQTWREARMRRLMREADLWGSTLDLPRPDFVGNAHAHKGVVHTMLIMGRTMRHLRVFNSWRGLWRSVGRYYNDLNVWGGWLFVLGGLLYFLGPLLLMQEVIDHDGAVYVSVAGVVAFLLAKLFVEARAIYSTLWDRPSRRPGSAYHTGVLSLTLGGLFLLAYAIFYLQRHPVAASWNWFCSCAWFLIGTFIFLVDSADHFQRPLWTRIVNSYFWGSLALFIGSVFYMISGTCNLNGIRDLQAPIQGDPFARRDVCSESLVIWFDLLGGFFYFVGAILFLVFAYGELWDAEQGVDPRCITRSGEGAPHPFRPREGTSGEPADPQPDTERFVPVSAAAEAGLIGTKRLVTCV